MSGCFSLSDRNLGMKSGIFGEQKLGFRHPTVEESIPAGIFCEPAMRDRPFRGVRSVIIFTGIRHHPTLLPKNISQSERQSFKTELSFITTMFKSTGNGMESDKSRFKCSLESTEEAYL